MRTPIALALILASSIIPAFAASPDTVYRVTVEARDGTSTIVAAPKLVLRPGQKGNMQVDGASGYQLSMQVSELDSGKIKACGTFESPKGKISPCFETALGQQVSVAVGDLSLAVTIDKAGS